MQVREGEGERHYFRKDGRVWIKGIKRIKLEEFYQIHTFKEKLESRIKSLNYVIQEHNAILQKQGKNIYIYMYMYIKIIT